MTRWVRQAIAATAVATVAQVGMATDLTVVSEVTAGKGKVLTSTQYLTKDKVRTSDGTTDTIMDIGAERLTFIDHKKKTYYETTLAELRAQFAELEKTLQENPMIARMLGGSIEAQVEKGSGNRTIAGYSCSQYFLTIGKKTRMEMWVTKDLEVPTQYYDARKMAYAAMGPGASRFDKLYEAMKEIGGFPLATILDSGMMGMKIKSRSEATEVRKGPIPADAFDPPAGYKKTKSPYQQK